MKQLKTLEFSELAYLYFKYGQTRRSDLDDNEDLCQEYYLYFIAVRAEIECRVAEPFITFINEHNNRCQYHSMSAG